MNEKKINVLGGYVGLDGNVYPAANVLRASPCGPEAPAGVQTPAVGNALVVARFAPDEIPVRHRRYGDGSEWITFDIPNGWDDVKKVCKKVLVYEGKRFTFSCWNSDRMECIFRWFPGMPEQVAKVVARKKIDHAA